MNEININEIFDRENISNEIKNILLNFDENCKNLMFKKGIYIYGSPGCGKTQFIMNLLGAIEYAKQAIKEGFLLDYYLTDNGNIVGISDQGEFIWWRDEDEC